MPAATADIKVDAVRGFGEVLLHGANFDEAKRSDRTSQQQGSPVTVRPPDGDRWQGTLALELLQQDAILTACLCRRAAGFGGMGCKDQIVEPQIKVIAVEAEDSRLTGPALG